jgi:hypothetical protein
MTSHTAFAAPSAAPALQRAARDAWLFLLPLILAASRRARPDPRSGQPAPLNVFTHSRSLGSSARRGVTTPNNDTLYSNAFVDTTQGPVSLEIPDCGSRYLSVQVMDMYTNNNFILSPRNPGGAAGRWRLISPDAHSRDARDLRMATPHGWLIARVLLDGPADLPAVHAIQDRLLLHGPVSAPPVEPATAASDWPIYFQAGATLLETDPPPFTKGLDAFMAVRDAGNGRDFSRMAYTAAAAAAIDAGVAAAAALVRSPPRANRFINGWTYPRADLGAYGDDFVFRAVVATSGLGALRPSEAMYMRSAGDGHGLFEGDGLYRLSLRELVPVAGFWSLTLYEALPDGRLFLTDNPLSRYSIGDRSVGLVRGPRGSLDIWIGRSDPGGERTANWLPAPRQAPFALTLRAYLPLQRLLTGSYRLPAVVKA